MEAEYVKVAHIDELREHRGRLVVVDGQEIALFKRNGRVYAIHNVCAHQHFSRLHEGEICDLTVTCPMHGWTYNLVTGRATSGDGMVRTYRVKVEGGDVLLHVSPER